MKGPGPHGITGVHVLEPAMQTCDNVKCFLVVINHARQPQLIQDPVNVSKLNQLTIELLFHPLL